MAPCAFGRVGVAHQALGAGAPSRQRASRPCGDDPSRGASLRSAGSEPSSIALGPAAKEPLLRARRFARLRRRRRLGGASRPRRGAGSLQPHLWWRGFRRDGWRALQPPPLSPGIGRTIPFNPGEPLAGDRGRVKPSPVDRRRRRGATRRPLSRAWRAGLMRARTPALCRRRLPPSRGQGTLTVARGMLCPGSCAPVPLQRRCNN